MERTAATGPSDRSKRLEYAGEPLDAVEIDRIDAQLDMSSPSGFKLAQLVGEFGL